jgi:phasin family protein
MSKTGKAGVKSGFDGIDPEAVVTSQYKNVEALRKANQLAVEGAQAVLRRQIEIGRDVMIELSAILGALARPSASPEDWMVSQAERSKKALESSVSNARELTELVRRANREAFDVITKRVTESLGEVRDYANKRGARR